MILFTGNSNLDLTMKISQILGLPIGKSRVAKFSDGEISISIDENVRGADVFLIQGLSVPTNDNLMELVLMADALSRASAGSITAVVPYYCYARQDRRSKAERVPISASVVAKMLGLNIDRLLTLDLHSEQTQGFFDIPVDNIYSTNALVDDILKNPKINANEVIIVSPDVGAVQRSRVISKILGCDLAIIDKRRPKANEIEIMNVIGVVENKSCIIIDDIVDTASTLVKGAQALKNNGAKNVFAYITHPILSGDSVEKIANSCIEELVITDSIPLTTRARECSKIRQVTVANLLAECILRMNKNESLSALFS